MEVKAHFRNARMAPRKLRVYRGVIKGLSAREAEAQLKFMPGYAPAILLQTLRSAVANAKHNFDIAPETLKVIDVIINGAFTLKRFQPVSKGMAHPILKRNSHVTIIVEDMVADGAKPKKRKVKKTKIEELTMEDLASGKVPKEGPHESIEDEQLKPNAETVARHSKQEQASNKVKMMQQGGDAKKTHRRKTVGD